MSERAPLKDRYPVKAPWWQTCTDGERQEWIRACMSEGRRVLLGEKAHYCRDWDGMTVDETAPEFECCLCFRGQDE